MEKLKHIGYSFHVLCFFFLLSCTERNSEVKYKELTVSRRAESWLSPQNVRAIEDSTARERMLESFLVDQDEYTKLVEEFGKETADKKAFSKSFIQFAEISDKDMYVADYYHLSKSELTDDTLLLNFRAKELVGGTYFGFIVTDGKYSGRFGHTLRCMTDEVPEVAVLYDSLSLHKMSYSKGDTIYGEFFIKALNKTDEVEFLSKGMFRSIVE